MIYQLSSDGTEYSLITYSGVPGVDEIVDPTILSEINGIPVKSVRLNAFMGFQKLSGTLTIPASIEELGSSAFSGKLIDTVIFEEGSPIKILNESTFSWCQHLKNVTLPEGLETIEMYAFNGCDLELEYIEIPANVKEMRRWAFQNCTNLKIVQINGNADMIISYEAFQYCGTAFGGDGVELYFPNIEKTCQLA